MLWTQHRETEYWERHGVKRGDRLAASATVATAIARLRERPRHKPWRTVRDALVGLPDPERAPPRGGVFADHRFQPGARSYPGHTGSPLDEPAKTKAGVHGVPGGENMLRRPDGSVRYFSIRESARLQTFPDDFMFHGAWSETMRQLGNAVPVDLAEIVARSVRNHLSAAGDRHARHPMSHLREGSSVAICSRQSAAMAPSRVRVATLTPPRCLPATIASVTAGARKARRITRAM